MITPTEAARLLGVHRSTLCKPQGRYYKYYHPSSKAHKDARFDLDGYIRDRDAEERAVADATMKIEHIRHTNGTTYSEIARRLGCSYSTVQQHNITHEHAKEILKW